MLKRSFESEESSTRERERDRTRFCEERGLQSTLWARQKSDVLTAGVKADSW